MEGETRRVQLPPRSEYRIELDAGEALSVRFVADPSGHYGDAEVFGAPLIGGTQERWYTFGNEAKFAISSWGGAEIELAGTASTEYMADEPSPVYTYYTNLHLNLERARIRAREQLRTDKNLVQSLKEQDVSKTEAVPSYDDPNAPPQNELYHAAGQGPRLMVVGPECAGKTSLIKFLANYAMRSPALASIEEGLEAERKAQQDEEEALSDDEDGPSARKATDGEEFSEVTGWWPMILALDPSEGAVPVPGCLSAIPLRPTPVNCLPSPSPALPYGVTPQTTGALPPTVSTAESVMPLVHWLGKQNVRENEQHTRRVVDCLAHQVEKRMIKDTRARMSGLLLDMPGVVTSDSRTRYSYIQYCARAFKLDMIVVLGHEKLNLELSKIFAADPTGSAIQIAVDVDEVYRQKLQDLQIRSYFYGMQPAIPQDVGSADGEEGTALYGGRAPLPGHAEPLGDRIAPSSALPIGAERVVSELQVVKLDPVNSSSDTSSLLHSIVALVDVPSDVELNEDGLPSEMSLLRAGVLGFIHVSEIDTNRKKMTVLSPKPGKLPTKTALIGNLHWQDA
ncbi:CLP1 [Malassezia furfur]|nr:CLP1 [Malassezia furfur]